MTREPAEVGSAANSYEILAKLAMGGMAEIFLARGASAAGVERYVVLKRVLRHRASDVHFVQMFLDEARLAAQLQHPNIAQVYDIGKLGDSYFFTMEYVHGETVRNLMSRSYGLRRQIPISAVLSIVAGAAAGLHHAHQRKGFDGRHLGIVHRDVSPSNLMISYEGTVKVVDFGVAKAAHRSTETQSGTVKGKISYMSPEQCKGAAEIDLRSDLFSLGIVMWEVLTMEKLFRRSSDFETMQAIVSEEVPPPSRLRPEVPPEIDRVVGRLLAKDPAQRFQNADELHEAIESIAVRVGSALSAASLGRYIRELFGQRPEPWIELAVQDQHPEVFTVTSEPIPNNLALSSAEEFDRKLSAVPALTDRLPTVQDSARPLQPTSPLRVGAELVATLPIGSDSQDLMRTLPIRDSAPSSQPLANQADAPPASQPGSDPMLPIQGAMAQSAIANAPMVHAAFTPASGLRRPHAPSVTPSSSPHYPIATGSSIPAFTPPASYPVASRASVERLNAEPRRSRALILFAPAVIIGIVIGIVLALSSDEPKPTVASREDTLTPGTTMMVATPETPAASTMPAPAGPEPTAPPTASEPTVAAPTVAVPTVAAPIAAAPTNKPTVPAPTVAASTSKPTVLAPSAAAPTNKPTVPTAAAPTNKPTVASTEPPPATEPTPDDAIVMPEDNVAKPDKPADKAAKSKPEAKTEPKPDPQALFKAADYAGAVAACSAAAQIGAINAPVCTMAACKAKQAAKAKRWFKHVSEAKKASVMKECDGVIAADKPAPVDPCKADPMACQH